MGRITRIITEKVRQLVPSNLVSDDFEATSNKRNEMMMAEATKFAEQLRAAESELTKFCKYTKGMSENTRTLLHTPLPRVYDYDETDTATRRDPHPTGEDTVDAAEVEAEDEQVKAAQQSLEARMTADVLIHFQAWNKSFQEAQQEMKELEKTRLEVDSRRRTVSKLDKQATKLTDKLENLAVQGDALEGATVAAASPPASPPPVEGGEITPALEVSSDSVDVAGAKPPATPEAAAAAEAAAKKAAMKHEKVDNKVVATRAQMQHKEAKKSSVEEKFLEDENAMFRKLSELIATAGSTRDHFKVAMQVIAEAFQDAVVSFNPFGAAAEAPKKDATAGVSVSAEEEAKVEVPAVTVDGTAGATTPMVVA